MTGYAITLSSPLARALLGIVALAVALFLIVPVLVIVPLSFSSGSFLSFPPPGFSLRWYQQLFSRSDWMDSAWLSIWIACVVALLSTVLGTAASFGLVRGKFPGQRLLVAFILSPLIIPGIIVAIAVYFFYARLQLVGSPVAIAVAHTALAVPFVVVNVSASLHGFDKRLEMAAQNLGAGAFDTFRLVILPSIRPGVVAGALFAFITSFDELIVALFIAGPSQVTLPLRMWESMRSSLEPTLAAVSTLAVVASVSLFLCASWLQRRAQAGAGKVVREGA
ncbi:putative spermidine/putrescine transport system permease protein [Pseudaminobacter salicylatoxidans]|uniref:Putative spermidine/putrescine transport system permease protein n=1 Tax=Pseudaminobacter salicylatoxidans TaxID=93369 RepID=A0A316CW42_PSESE|nr:ABC transporter permease [Pseudaminobacter salicylatoxidans]PWJ86314.1 putative spermidine/putrescine transport system permease protein [Pseudaminobacter salicylatoxidans]